MKTECTDNKQRWINVIDEKHPAAHYIMIVDPLGQPIKGIKSYDILTKEAVIYVTDPENPKKTLMIDNKPVFETIKLPYSRLVFVEYGEGLAKSQYTKEELEGLTQTGKQ